jgi:hypothetical protein
MRWYISLIKSLVLPFALKCFLAHAGGIYGYFDPTPVVAGQLVTLTLDIVNPCGSIAEMRRLTSVTVQGNVITVTHVGFCYNLLLTSLRTVKGVPVPRLAEGVYHVRFVRTAPDGTILYDSDAAGEVNILSTLTVVSQAAAFEAQRVPVFQSIELLLLSPLIAFAAFLRIRQRIT